MKRGRRLEHEIARSLRELEPRIWWRKLIDRRWRKSPFDYLVLSPYRNYAIECKMTRLPSFPFTNLNEGQERALRYFERVSENNGAYVFINYRNEEINELYAIPYREYTMLKEHCINSLGRNSLPRGILQSSSIIKRIERAKFINGYGWDLLPFFLESHSF